MEKGVGILFRVWSALKFLLRVSLCLGAIALLLLGFLGILVGSHGPDVRTVVDGVFTVLGSGFYLCAGRKLKIQRIYLSTGVILMLAVNQRRNSFELCRKTEPRADSAWGLLARIAFRTRFCRIPHGMHGVSSLI